MKSFFKRTPAGLLALAVAQAASAGSAPYFIPLTSSELVDTADGTKVINPDNPNEFLQLVGVDERNKPWSTPAGVTLSNLTSMEEIENAIGQSVVRVDNGQNSSMWDMLAYDPSGRYVFIPHETTFGAGVSRYDSLTDTTEILFMGDETGSAGFAADTDFGAFDPVRWTPNGTIIAGEEWSGTGRLVEYCDPLGPAPTDPVVGGSELVVGDCVNNPNADVQVLSDMPLSSQEGLSFGLDDPNGVMYFVDEDRSGSIYKSVFVTPGDYSKAQTFALKVTAFTGDVTLQFRDDAIDTLPRVGAATWEPITDANGDPLPGVTDPTSAPFAAADSADDVGGTPYGRPEDTSIARLANGNEVIYFTATSENAVYSIEETANGPFVRLFAQGPISRADGGSVAQGPETPTNVGFPATSGEMNSPDNLAQDSLGNIYIIEDSPNTRTIGATGGDIWFARDTDTDGVAESLDHFLSLQVAGSEATGMIFNPVDPTKFVVAIQHPYSTILSDLDNDATNGNFIDNDDGPSGDDANGERASAGAGDAMWEFDISNAQPPECTGPRSAFITFNQETRRFVRACSSQRDFNAIDQLVDSEDPNDFPQP